MLHTDAAKCRVKIILTKDHDHQAWTTEFYVQSLLSKESTFCIPYTQCSQIACAVFCQVFPFYQEFQHTEVMTN